jgi:hypothetical protein
MIQLNSLAGDKLIGYITGLRSKLHRQRTFSKLSEAGLHSLVVLSMLLPNLSLPVVVVEGEENRDGASRPEYR